MRWKLYLKRKMSAPTPRVQTASRHRLTLEAWDAKRGLPAPSSFETLYTGTHCKSVHRLLYKLNLLVKACRL